MRRVLVTGAAKGIGRAVAEAFAERGDQLILMDVDGEGLAEVVEALTALGARVEAGLGSVANNAHCEAIAALGEGLRHRPADALCRTGHQYPPHRASPFRPGTLDFSISIA